MNRSKFATIRPEDRLVEVSYMNSKFQLVTFQHGKSCYIIASRMEVRAFRYNLGSASLLVQTDVFLSFNIPSRLVNSVQHQQFLDY